MKNVFLCLIVFSTVHVFAADMTVKSCADYSVSLNSVYSMKTYAKSSVKVFEIDMEEPAVAPVGVAVAIDRGDDLSTMESFCRYVPGFASVDVKGAKSTYDKLTNTISIAMSARQLDENGNATTKLLTISVNKGAKLEADLVKASLK